jgi:hypothetical protein
MSAKLRERLIGRVGMCLNTARIHPDKTVQDENQIRAKAYMTAADDAEHDDECNALVDLWKAVTNAEKLGHLALPEHQGVRSALNALEKVWTGK